MKRIGIADTTFASVDTHWHMCAMDWLNKSNWNKLHFTPHRAIQTRVKMNLEEVEKLDDDGRHT